ncbi:E3 [Psittacine adenovirus 5]|nr:E3 [Psittacine adenovirus 5]QER78612.2 E3 [Psittacine adenovirus 5]
MNLILFSTLMETISPACLSQEELFPSQETTQSCMEGLLTLQDKIQLWRKHRSECKAVNCIAEEAKVEDIVFVKDYPEVIDCTIGFFHKLNYLTSVKEILVYEGQDPVEFFYDDGNLCVSVKCDCDQTFSNGCILHMFHILCKAVMLVEDGAYPLSCMSFPPPLGCSLPRIEEEEINLDGANRKFCDECNTPELYCSCLDAALNKTQFLAQLSSFKLCHFCATFMPGCRCRHKIFFLYKFYSSFIIDGKVPKRLNQVKRIAYLSTCNVQVCLNCNRMYTHCICDSSYRKIYPAM